MKKLLFLALACFFLNATCFSQSIVASLTGYPIVTTGWVVGGTASAVDSTIRLTTSAGSENGYAYYNSALNVTACGQFAVDFDWRISSPGGLGVADGMAFYIINPLTGFVGGGGLGLPNPLTGFVFTLDTWDNDGDGLNPECELFGYPTPSTYAEADPGHRLGPILGHVTYMADGSWHHCKITYNSGTIKVYLNGGLTPAMTGTYSLTTAGYFGFSAATGGGYSEQRIKEVFITAYNISPIYGSDTVCQGSTTPLYDSSAGGTWSSGNTAVATVGLTSGVVTGVSVGTAVITYSYNSGACTSTTTVDVVAPATAIGSAPNVCAGTTVTFTDATPGGFWSSSNTAVATVGSGTGIVGGVTAGTATITYSTGGTCYATANVTVTTVPATIAGTLSVCTGATTSLTDAVGGGTWTSSNTTVATVVSGSGVIYGVIPGTTTITYSVGGICTTSSVVTVNASPPAISGPSSVCTGATITLSDATGGGTWSSVSPGIATVTPGPSGSTIVTGVATFTGFTSIVYTAPGGCTATKQITVDPLPSSIIGTPGVCVGTTTSLIDFGGGTWASSNPSLATIGLTTGIVGGIAAGTVIDTFTLPTGCFTTYSLVIYPLPAPITGTLTVCEGATSTLSDGTSGGSWSTNNGTVATIDPFAGVLTGGGVADTTSVFYTSILGCSASAVATVDAAPPPITGPSALCPGSSAPLSDAEPGGTWTSSNTVVATVGLTSGIVYGLSPGFVNITYTAPSGCSNVISITVYSPPAAITGTMHVCMGQTTILLDGSTGGTWTSGNTAVATVTLGPPGGGVVTGVSAGTAVISYTQSGTGCFSTAVVTVNSAPSVISGSHTVCLGSTDTLTDITVGGTWTSSSAGIASVGLTTGIVTGGATTGAATITYSMGGTCVATFTVTVTPLPPACTVTGGGAYCAGGAGVSIGLSCSTTGVSYQLFLGGTPVGLPVTGTGAAISFGAITTAGTYTVIGTYITTGCSRAMTGSATVTINPLPAAFSVTGGGTYCAGGTGVAIGLSGSATGVTYKLFLGATTEATVTGTGGAIGFGTFTAAGTYTVTATSAGGCTSAMTGSATITISPLPPACPVTGGGTYCAGGAGEPIGLGCSTIGINYQLMLGPTIVGAPVAGTGGAITFGTFTAAGIYTVVATNSVTGCARNMTGSATITISPIPTITGGTAVCVGSSIPLAATPAGGSWSSSNTANVTVSSTGVATGITTGTCATITYTSPAGCTTTTTVCVSPSPSIITGPASVCVGACMTLGDAVSGGTWTSGSPAIATAGLSSGSICGVSPGTATISYSLGSGCTVTTVVDVTPAPGAIGGPSVVCSGATISLTDATGGGTWTSSNTAVATVAPSGSPAAAGGVTAGTATITYTVGGCMATKNITVNFAPTPIGGPGVVCTGSLISLTDGISGGTWTSSSTTVATVDSVSGSVKGVIATTTGMATITYSLGGSCVVTKVVTVNPIAPITGATALCVSATTTLGEAVGGGTWTTSAPGIATITAAGSVTGISPGTSLITYATAGCSATRIMTVQPAPVPITGVMSVCAGGGTTTLIDTVSGGTWTSSNTAVASVDAASGLVTGGALTGTATITYSLGGGCTKTAVVTVNPQPVVTAVTTTHVCAGSTITLSGSPAGGTWTSSNTATATVTGGIVTGGTVATATTVTITYTIGTGCSRSTIITVNPVPPPITGNTTVCEGVSTDLSDGVTGGTWTSGNTAVATAGLTSGIITGVSAGTTTVTYIAGGCPATVTVSVQPPPPAISGASSVCAGGTVTLVDGTPGGTWISANTAIATVNSASGAVTGEAAGTVLISYTVGTGCTQIKTIIVNPLSPIIGPSVVCQGQFITLADTTEGGSWASSNTLVATAVTVDLATGMITGAGAGTTTIIYTLPTGCATSWVVTVNAAPPPISGTAQVCAGTTTTLVETVAGSWSSGNTAIATVTASGVVSGITAGTAMITFTSSGTACPALRVVTVNPLPGVISGPEQVCIGSCITLTDPAAGGTWGSSSPAIATAGLTSGVICGLMPGTVSVTYTLPTGCATGTGITVNTLPDSITGNRVICLGQSTLLTGYPGGGTWSSSNTAMLVAGVSTGVVTGMLPGDTLVTYTDPAGCALSTHVTVNMNPAPISGNPGSMCQGTNAILTDFMGGGTWSSDNGAVATIDSATGEVTALSPGCVVITYSVATGCTATASLCVNAAPNPITGPDAICLTTTVTLTETSTGGAWSSSNTTVAPVDPSGDVTGSSVGTATISYTALGCSATKSVTVNPQPGAITAPAQVCVGSTITATDAVPGGTWSSSDPTIATIDSTTGVLYGVFSVTGGLPVTVTYSLGAGCTTFTTVIVNPVPVAISAPPLICVGQTVAVSDGTPSGVWSTATPAIATADSSAGTVTGVAAGTTLVSYTLPTGCAATVEMTVHAAPTPIIGIPYICIGSTRAYTDPIPGGVWSSSNTTVATIDAGTGIATGLTLGSATIMYSMGAGCNQTESVTVVQLPGVFNVTGGGNYCAGGIGVPIGLSGSATGVDYYLYLGATPTGMFAGTGSPLSFGLQTVAGSYTVIAVSTTTTCSNIMSGSATVSIHPSTTPTVNISAAPGDTVCAGTATTLTAIPDSGGLAPTYQWAVNGVSVGVGLTYTFVPANGDVVRVGMTSTIQCPSPATVFDSLKLTVNPHQRPAALIGITPHDTVCAGTVVHLAATPAYGGTAPVYTWLKNGFISGSGATYSYVPANGDSFRVIMVSNYPCILGPDSVSSPELVITVDTPLVPIVSITASPGTNIGRNESDTLTAVVVNGGLNPTYQWYRNGWPIAAATNATYVSSTYDLAIEDSMSVMVTSDAICSMTSHQWVYINASNVGVKQVTGAGSDIVVVPNPNKGIFTIRGTLATTADQEVTIEVTDMLGQVVYRGKVMAQGGRINQQVSLAPTVANGMYILSLGTDTDNKVFHIVVEQ